MTEAQYTGTTDNPQYKGLFGRIKGLIYKEQPIIEEIPPILDETFEEKPLLLTEEVEPVSLAVEGLEIYMAALEARNTTYSPSMEEIMEAGGFDLGLVRDKLAIQQEARKYNSVAGPSLKELLTLHEENPDWYKETTNRDHKPSQVLIYMDGKVSRRDFPQYQERNLHEMTSFFYCIARENGNALHLNPEALLKQAFNLMGKSPERDELGRDKEFMDTAYDLAGEVLKKVSEEKTATL